MIIMWEPNEGCKFPLMGEVIEDTGRFYRVKVTSYSKKSDAKLVDKEFMVNKKIAQVMK